MAASKSYFPLYRRVLFPRTVYQRISAHLLFWAFYFALHLLFFVPDLSERLIDVRVLFAYIIYYGRFIPIYYLCNTIFQVTRTRFGTEMGFLLVLAFIVPLTHTVNTVLYRFYDTYIGFEVLPVNFGRIGKWYTKAISDRSRWDWLVLFYDVVELQLLALPVAIKAVKFGAAAEMHETEGRRIKVQSELNMLRSQLTPHFIFNILNAASSELKKTSRSASKYLYQAAELIRFSLYDSGREYISLKREFEYIRQYVELESMRTSQRAEISFLVFGTVEAIHRVPTQMLITLVENAFKHSVHATSESSTVGIEATIKDDFLLFSVVNSIPSDYVRNITSKSSYSGIGLDNVKRTLELRFPGEYKLDILSTSKIFSVELGIPLLT